MTTTSHIPTASAPLLSPSQSSRRKPPPRPLITPQKSIANSPGGYNPSLFQSYLQPSISSPLALKSPHITSTEQDRNLVYRDNPTMDGGPISFKEYLQQRQRLRSDDTRTDTTLEGENVLLNYEDDSSESEDSSDDETTGFKDNIGHFDDSDESESENGHTISFAKTHMTGISTGFHLSNWITGKRPQFPDQQSKIFFQRELQDVGGDQSKDSVEHLDPGSDDCGNATSVTHSRTNNVQTREIPNYQEETIEQVRQEAKIATEKQIEQMRIEHSRNMDSLRQKLKVEWERETEIKIREAVSKERLHLEAAHEKQTQEMIFKAVNEVREQMRKQHHEEKQQAIQEQVKSNEALRTRLRHEVEDRIREEMEQQFRLELAQFEEQKAEELKRLKIEYLNKLEEERQNVRQQVLREELGKVQAPNIMNDVYQQKESGNGSSGATRSDPAFNMSYTTSQQFREEQQGIADWERNLLNNIHCMDPRDVANHLLEQARQSRASSDHSIGETSKTNSHSPKRSIKVTFAEPESRHMDHSKSASQERPRSEAGGKSNKTSTKLSKRGNHVQKPVHAAPSRSPSRGKIYEEVLRVMVKNKDSSLLNNALEQPRSSMNKKLTDILREFDVLHPIITDWKTQESIHQYKFVEQCKFLENMLAFPRDQNKASVKNRVKNLLEWVSNHSFQHTIALN